MRAVPTSIRGASRAATAMAMNGSRPGRLVRPHDREPVGVGAADAVDDDVE